MDEDNAWVSVLAEQGNADRRNVNHGEVESLSLGVPVWAAASERVSRRLSSAGSGGAMPAPRLP